MSALPFGTRVRVITDGYDHFEPQLGLEGVVIDKYQDLLLYRGFDIVVKLDITNNSRLYSFKDGDVEIIYPDYRTDQMADESEDLL